MNDRASRLLLLGSVFVIATCGLVYELIAGTIASYHHRLPIERKAEA